MPLFDFRCQTCGHVFEELVSSSSAPPRCPKCQSDNVARLLSRFAIRSGSSSSPTPSGSGHNHSCNSFG